jgi:hypothetical protein
MFRRLLVCSIFFGSLFMGAICHAGLYDNPTVAIMPFRNKTSVNWENFGDCSDQAKARLNALVLERPDIFTDADRDELSDIVGEQSLAQTGLTDPSNAVEMGKLLSAEYKIYGSITALATKENHVHVGFDNASGGNAQHNVHAYVMLKVVEVKTGRVVLIGMGTGESASTHTDIRIDDKSLQLGTVRVSSVQAINAVDKAVEDAVYGKEGIFTKMGFEKLPTGRRG